jgi:hypothetical protein
MTYNGIVQAQSVLVNDTEGTKTTITTQMSSMVIVIMEACFQVIETEIKNQRDHQTGMDRHLLQLENHTMMIDDNIAAMMVHWNITPHQKCKATTTLNDIEQQHHELEDSSVYAPHTATFTMDTGDLDECL